MINDKQLIIFISVKIMKSESFCQQFIHDIDNMENSHMFLVSSVIETNFFTVNSNKYMKLLVVDSF